VNANVQRLILACVAAAAVAVAAAAWFSDGHIRPELGGFVGLCFWTGLTLIGSLLPVRLPKGTVVSVSAAPVMATVVLGGPFAAAIVAAFGTTDGREIRGLAAAFTGRRGDPEFRDQVPWYGTLFNHASVVLSVVAGGWLYEVVLGASSDLGAIATFVAFAGLLMASAVFYLLNGLLAILAVSARTGAAVGTIWAQDLGGIAFNFGGLAPLAWLMAEIFLLPEGAGWWATPLFVIPLVTTRLALNRYVETRELFEQTIGALANAVDARDRYTRGHSGRVSHIAEAMCRVMKLPESEIEKIKWAGLLHDVGKIGVRDNVLLKEGPLDKEERRLMNQHPTIGAEIVSPARSLSAEAPLIHAHHEWFNGSGYPSGTEAFDIPLGARILSVADAYEAMTSPRPYRKTPLTHEVAVGELEKFAGIQFDPEIVPVLVNLDRSILDRPAYSDDELPTMMHAPDPRDRDASAETTGAPPADVTPADSPPSRPMLASDDVP
jgi:putative nucleotidyltransferase with HDIG domain